MNVNVQYLRALAALLVLLHHSSLRVEGFYKIDPMNGFGDILALVGVSLFFCISGYLMTTLISRSSPGVFLWHRVARLYPPFLVAVAVAIALNLIFGKPIPNYDWWTLTLLPLQRHGPLQVEWTLNYEVAFYIISAVFCISMLKAFHKPALFVWLALIIISATFLGDFATSQFPTFYELPLSSWTASFIVGGIAGYSRDQSMIKRNAGWIGFSGLLLVGVLVVFPKATAWVPAYMVAFPLGLIVMSAFALDPVVRSPFLQRLGDDSYAIYLIHQTVCAWAVGLLARHIPNAYVLFAVLIALSIRSGMVLGSLDLWMYARLKNVWGRREPALVHSPAQTS